MGPQKPTVKLVLEEINFVKDLIVQQKKEMNIMQDGLISALDKLSLSNDNIMQESKNAIKMVAQHSQSIQRKANEEYLMIISYEQERNEPLYCQTVLNTFISKVDILGHEIIFSNKHKTLYQVKLSNKFKVNLVLKLKSCLKGRSLYIHRPYTDIEKQTRSKQIQQAKEIAKTERFKIVKNKLYIGDSSYEWSSELENFLVVHVENATEKSLTVSNVTSCEISASANCEMKDKDTDHSEGLMEASCSRNIEEDQVTKNDLMRAVIEMEKKFDRITRSSYKLTEKLDDINEKYKRQIQPP